MGWAQAQKEAQHHPHPRKELTGLGSAAVGEAEVISMRGYIDGESVRGGPCAPKQPPDSSS